MTALDPTPVLRSRRDALEQLDDLRERLCSFLDRPSAQGFRLVTSSTQQFLRFESEDVFPDLASAWFPEQRVAALVDGHEALVARLNTLTWAVPGTPEVQTEALRLRHELLAHIDRYNDLRLPRGSLIGGG